MHDMNNVFAPSQPEKRVTVVITAKEAHLIVILRKYQFGKILVHKADGKLIRVEPNESQLLSEEEGLKSIQSL